MRRELLPVMHEPGSVHTTTSQTTSNGSWMKPNISEHNELKEHRSLQFGGP
jgi:hypothetical protein